MVLFLLQVYPDMWFSGEQGKTERRLGIFTMSPVRSKSSLPRSLDSFCRFNVCALKTSDELSEKS